MAAPLWSRHMHGRSGRLQAADRARNEGGPDEQLGAFHTDGLIVAAGQLVRQARHCLSAGDA